MAPPLDRRLRALLGEMHAAGVVTAAVAVVADAADEVARAAVGLPGGLAERPLEAIFDLGSLTKPFMAHLAIAEDWMDGLPLGFPLADAFPARGLPVHPRLAPRTVEDLLCHRAGFVPWYPFYATCSSTEEVLARLLAGEGPEGTPLLGAAAGTYSDLGYLLWGFLFRDFQPSRIDAALQDQVLIHLDLTTVTAPPGPGEDVVPCRLDNGKEVELAAELGIEVEPRHPRLRGRPQDGNARFLHGLLGEVPGHAGLFAPASALVRFGREWLDPRPGPGEEHRQRAFAVEGSWALGWKRRTPDGAAAPLSGSAFGHYGFPGGSLWIDPEAERVWVLLAYKAHSAVDLTPWRRRFHGLGEGGAP